MPELTSERKRSGAGLPGRSPEKGGKYLYAIMTGSGERIFDFAGIEGASVYSISDGRIGAIVSDVSNKKVRPERRHIGAHQQVLKRLMEESTVLPVSFGIIADGYKAIRKILSRYQEVLLIQLEHVNGKVEMGLRVTCDVLNIFEYFVNTHRELRVARDRLLGSYREPTQENKIEIGRMFDRILNEDREAYTEKVEKILSRYCFEIKRSRCRNEREIMNLACLVSREGQREFEHGVVETARLFDNNFAFDYNGPWAPHNFVEIDLKF